jgi:hypothetical protein
MGRRQFSDISTPVAAMSVNPFKLIPHQGGA